MVVPVADVMAELPIGLGGVAGLATAHLIAVKGKGFDDRRNPASCVCHAAMVD
jgi:hypothetical protein